MWLSEDKLKGKTAHFRLPSASQKRTCLSSLIKHKWYEGEKIEQKSMYSINNNDFKKVFSLQRESMKYSRFLQIKISTYFETVS